MGKPSDTAMSALTDEERKALEEAEAEEGEAEAEARAELDAADDDAKKTPERDPKTGRFKSKSKDDEDGDDAGDDDGARNDDDDADAGAGEDAGEDDEDDDAGKDDDAGDEDDEDDDDADLDRPVVPQWTAPADAEQKLKEIADKRAALADQFDAGDITAREFTAETAELNRQEREIERQQDRAQMAEDMRTEAWLNRTVPEFLSKHTAYKTNETLHNMLDAEVRKLQVKAMEKGADPLDPRILRRAHKAISAAVESLTGKKPASDGEGEHEPREDRRERKSKDAGKDAGKRPKSPPTLARIPAADMEDTSSEFADLDRLADEDPIKYEATLARMPAHEKERYLAQ